MRENRRSGTWRNDSSGKSNRLWGHQHTHTFRTAPTSAIFFDVTGPLLWELERCSRRCQVRHAQYYYYFFTLLLFLFRRLWGSKPSAETYFSRRRDKHCSRAAQQAGFWRRRASIRPQRRGSWRGGIVLPSVEVKWQREFFLISSHGRCRFLGILPKRGFWCQARL